MHEDLIAETFAERERLAAMLAALADDHWNAPSLCESWRVREVVAHLTLPFRVSPPRLLMGIARSRFSFDRFADHDARATAARMTELLELYAANIDNPWRPPGGGEAAALGHEVIHGLDITEPLGLPGPSSERIARVLLHTTPRGLASFGVDLRDVHYTASDADVSVGDSSAYTRVLPVKDILLHLTGRITPHRQDEETWPR